MAKKETFKLGERVKIRVKKRRRATPVRPSPDDRRYGPPPFGEASQPDAKPLITLHDMSQWFVCKRFRENLSSVGLSAADYFALKLTSPTDFFYWSEMFYEAQRIGFINDQISWTNVISQSLLRGVSDTGFPPLPEDADSPPSGDIKIFDELDVENYDGASSEVYRTNDRCWLIPKNGEALGLTLKVGAKQAGIGGSGWVDKPGARAAESDDLTMPIANGTTAWARSDNRRYLSKPGCFRPNLPKNRYPIQIESAGHFYEPFDTADTENFKVTAEPSFDAEEVSGRFTVDKKQVRVFLSPQIWKFAYSAYDLTIYDFARTLNPQKWFRYCRWAIDPFYPGENYTTRNRHRYGATATSAADPIENDGNLYFYQEDEDFLSLPISASGFPHVTNDQQQIALLAQHQLGVGMYRYWQTTFLPEFGNNHWAIKGEITVTNTQTPQQRLVGAVKLKKDSNDKFYIWRKTATAREIVTLYSGKTSPVAVGAHILLSWFDADGSGAVYGIPADEQFFLINESNYEGQDY